MSIKLKNSVKSNAQFVQDVTLEPLMDFKKKKGKGISVAD